MAYCPQCDLWKGRTVLQRREREHRTPLRQIPHLLVLRKEGQVLESLRQAHQKLGEIIAAVQKADPDDAPGTEKWSSL